MSRASDRKTIRPVDYAAEVLGLVKKATHDGLRVGQIMSNVFYDVAKTGTDPFHISDEKLLDFVRKYVSS